jgi:hypothetical protein
MILEIEMASGTVKRLLRPPDSDEFPRRRSAR